MLRVDLSDCCFYSVIEGQQARPLDISRLIEWVVPSNPRVSAVSFRDDFPKIDHSVLKVFMVPERSISSRIVRVPVLILASWRGMQV